MSDAPPSAALTKGELRASLRARRAAVSPQARERASREVAAKLLAAVDWEDVGTLHLYASVPEWGELDTTSVVETVQERWPRIEIVSPPHGRDQPLPQRSFDVIVVPVLGFDELNFRLGLGVGFYDRFLASQPEARKIGLAYRWALVPGGLPHEPHDVPLDMIVCDG